MLQRKMRKFWFLILFFSLFSLVVLWYFIGQKPPSEHLRDDWVSLRLLEGQQEYVDKKGLHVVVGHYVGDMSNVPNLTDEIINKNMFNPLPDEGKNGMPVLIPPHLSSKMQQLYKINSFNLMASDKIPLNRTLPDFRRKRCRGKYTDIEGLPKTSVVIVFHNEAWSTLLRTVWSVILRSPRSLLQEILLVDDASTRKFLGKDLEDYIKTLEVPTRIIRSPVREGLIRARLRGAQAAEGDLLTFLDAHCECTQGWLEPLVIRVAEDRTRVACPLIDIISDDTFAYIRAFEHHWGAFNWDLHFRWYFISGPEINRKKKKLQDLADPYRTPAMAGGLFTMDRKYFFDIGSYDEKMEVWGGENIEMSLRIWQCGGSVEIVPCSHVGHVFRKSSPYSFPAGLGTQVLSANLARVALVWMDEWKEFFFKFHPSADKLRDEQQIRSRLELKKNLKCKGFKWYLENVWSDHYFPTHGRFFGKVRSIARNECLEKPVGRGRLNQPLGPATLGLCAGSLTLSQMWVKTGENGPGFIATNDNVCLDAPDIDSTTETYPRVRVVACSGFPRQHWKFNIKSKTLEHASSGMCLDIPSDGSLDKGLVLNACGQYPSQKWSLEAVPWE